MDIGYKGRLQYKVWGFSFGSDVIYKLFFSISFCLEEFRGSYGFFFVRMNLFCIRNVDGEIEEK